MERVTGRSSVATALLRHPCLMVFALALVVRAALAGALRWRYDGVLFGDEATYSMLAAQAATDMTAGWDDYTHQLYDTSATFVYPLRGLYEVFDTEILVGQLLVAVLGAAVAALTMRLALFALPTRWALVAGLAVALLPSQVLWSSLTLKDAASWVLLSGTAVLVAFAARARRAVPAVGLLLAAAVVLLLLSRIREHTLVVACLALALTAWVGGSTQRLPRAATGVLVAAVLPWAVGLGPFGTDLIASRAGTLEMQRAAGAAGATTALVEPPAVVSPGSHPRSRGRGEAPGSGPTEAPTDKSTAPGSAPSQQQAPRPGQDLFGGFSDSAGAANLAYLPRGLSAMVLEPYPWQPAPSRAVAIAKLEMLLWYPLVLLALIGVTALRRHASILLFPLVVGAGTATMWALVEGNFGTAYRHRGEFVWVVALAAAFGVRAVARRLRTGRRADEALHAPASATVPARPEPTSSLSGRVSN